MRDLVGTASSVELENGVEIERFNMRGAYARAMYGGGAPERAKAEEVREWIGKTQAWPRTIAMLEKMARSWDLTAEMQDERSKQDSMRDEK